MAHIKEPKAVDFLIQSEPLTNEIRLEISAFIKTYQSKSSNPKTKKKTARTKAVPVH